uniref:Uncharacterized protein n=1 Tax=Tetranychus urticae TaxID=32264 RepID=T1KM97_TETUR
MDQPSNQRSENSIETIFLELENTRKKRKKQDFDWDIDNCIKLLELRKSMNATFIKDYHTGDSWIKLVKAAGWNIKWEAVRSRYNYLRKTGVPSKFRKPKTGIAGDVAFGNKITKLSTLIHEAIIDNQKYNPLKVIDTSVPETSTENENLSTDHSTAEPTIQPQTSSENQAEQCQPQQDDDETLFYLPENDLCESPMPDNIESQTTHNDATDSHSPPNDFFSFDDPDHTGRSNNNEQQDSASSELSSQLSNFLAVRVRKRPPTYRELIMDGQKNLERIGDDIHNFTQTRIRADDVINLDLSR